MSASYPSSAKSFTALVDGVDYPQVTQVNQAYDEITALETALLSTGLAHNLFPDATANNRDLGSTTKKWNNLYLNGAATIGGSVTASGLTLSSGPIGMNTSDGADNGLVNITGGGSQTQTRGAILQLYGNEHPTRAGDAVLYTGNVAGATFDVVKNDGSNGLSMDGSTGALAIVNGGTISGTWGGNPEFTGQLHLSQNPVKFTEIADPAAPSANTGLLYMRDNGSGKTELVVRFPTGAVQVIKTEP